MRHLLPRAKMRVQAEPYPVEKSRSERVYRLNEVEVYTHTHTHTHTHIFVGFIDHIELFGDVNTLVIILPL